MFALKQAPPRRRFLLGAQVAHRPGTGGLDRELVGASLLARLPTFSRRCQHKSPLFVPQSHLHVKYPWMRTQDLVRLSRLLQVVLGGRGRACDRHGGKERDDLFSKL